MPGMNVMFFPLLECRGAVAVSKKFKQSVNPRARSWCLRWRRGRHMAIPEVDKSLTKDFAGNSGERQKREWPHKHWGFMVGLGGLEPPTSPLSGSFMVLYAWYDGDSEINVLHQRLCE
jgi:hypothetical protein